MPDIVRSNQYTLQSGPFTIELIFPCPEVEDYTVRTLGGPAGCDFFSDDEFLAWEEFRARVGNLQDQAAGFALNREVYHACQA